MFTRIAIPILVGIAAFLGFQAYQTNDQPTATGEALADVTVPVLNGTAFAGQIAFDANCAVCHGENAAGQDGIAPPLVHIIYEPDHHSDMSFVLAAKRGVRQHHWPFGNMPAIEGINDNEIATIIAYIRTLQRANGIQ